MANVNAQKRRLTRKEEKETKKINLAFEKVCNSFHDFLFWQDWDEVTHITFDEGEEIPVEELNMFQDFNNRWIKWCEQWRANRTHNTPVNENAFYDWAIDNTKTNDYDKPIDFNYSQLPFVHGII